MKHINIVANLGDAGRQDEQPKRLRLLAYSGGIMPIDGRPVLIDLAGLDLPERVPILADHRNELGAVIGHGEPTVENGRLYVMVELAPGEVAQQVADLLQAGTPLQASVGVEILESQMLPPSETVECNGQIHEIVSPTMLVTRGRLREVSVVVVGADHQTTASVAAIRQQAAFAARERSRISEIESLAAKWRSSVPEADSWASGAIEDGTAPWEFETRLKAIARSATVIPVTHSTSTGTPTKGLLTAALLCSAGKDDLAAKHFGERAVGLALRMPDRSLLGIFRMALQNEGREVPSDRSALIRASMSTYTIPGLLSDAMGKALLNEYRNSPASWRTFSRIMSAVSFRQQSAIRPSFVGGLEHVPPGGQLKHGTLGEDAIPWQISQFAKMIAIDRTTIINDDLSFLSDLAPSLGRAAMRSLSDLVWSTILADTTHFHANNGNLLDSNSSLSVDTLEQAVSLMRSQRDADGNNLDIAPHVLAVPPETESTARRILNSENLGVTNGEPTGNAMQNVVELAVEPRISNSKFAGSDSTQWFLFASPMDAPIIVGFLDGKQTPTVETEPLPPDRLGLSMRVIFDYGCALGDFRAGVKATGD